MKFLHLSDLHIGLKLINRDLLEDQKYILEQIIGIARKEKPDAIVIAGDIYDKAIPGAEAVSLLNQFVTKLNQEVESAELMMISGNHDNAIRIDLFREVLCNQKIDMVGVPPTKPGEHIKKVVLEDEFGKVNFYLLPFVKPSMVKQIVGEDENGNHLSYDESIRRLLAREEIDEIERNVLVSHQFYLPVGTSPEQVERMDSEIRMVGNIDEVKADVLAAFDYAALGHIHKPMKVGSEFLRYCGTPLACSFSEAGQEKGIVCVELLEKGSRSVRVIPLKPLHPVSIIKGSYEKVLQQGCSDYVRVVLTDQEDLDVMEMQERLHLAFPNLLEIQREHVRRISYEISTAESVEMDPLALCTSFLKEVSEEEKELLADVINTVKEAE